jgi:hypothetical protein
MMPSQCLYRYSFIGGIRDGAFAVSGLNGPLTRRFMRHSKALALAESRATRRIARAAPRTATSVRVSDDPFGGERAASKSAVLAQNPTRMDTMDPPRPLSPLGVARARASTGLAEQEPIEPDSGVNQVGH